VSAPLSLAVPIYGHTRLVGLFGWPVEHSVSPPMHNAAFQAIGLDWCYVPFAVRPERLATALAGARALGLRGVNATVPHKQALLPLVDRLTPAAQAIQAVNTVLFAEDHTLGHNTDAEGFLRALRAEGFDPAGCHALLLGAGGAARAVCYGLASAGAQVTILNRTVARAEELACAITAQVPAARIQADALTADALTARLPADLVVNATSLGMWPHVEASPWPDEAPFPSSALAYDLVYNPRETRFMATALAVGAHAANGLTMLVQQGAAAFALWTGVEPPTDIMLAACQQALEGG
jgi:shikimate dehydrogenase